MVVAAVAVCADARAEGCAFPAARGVLERFAGENVADKFSFERMEAAEPQAEVSARDGKILVRATDENRAAAAHVRGAGAQTGGGAGSPFAAPDVHHVDRAPELKPERLRAPSARWPARQLLFEAMGVVFCRSWQCG